MVSGNPMNWRCANPTRPPVDLEDVTEYRDHHLHAIEGIFGEQLVWQCGGCGIERRSTAYINESCPGV